MSLKPEKINELSPVIHEEERRRGEWEALPSELCTFGCQYFGSFESCTCAANKEHRESRSAYLATKLDLITEALVDAMRAKREGRRYKEERNQQSITIYYGRTKEVFTYEHHLALALYRVLDLMGFYGVEYKDPKIAPDGDPISFIRITIETVISRASLLYGGYYMVDNNQVYYSGPVRWLMRIAELDNIDLEWHLDALRKYQWGE